MTTPVRPCLTIDQVLGWGAVGIRSDAPELWDEVDMRESLVDVSLWLDDPNPYLPVPAPDQLLELARFADQLPPKEALWLVRDIDRNLLLRQRLGQDPALRSIVVLTAAKRVLLGVRLKAHADAPEHRRT